jgi:hypothetical protein
MNKPPQGGAPQRGAPEDRAAGWRQGGDTDLLRKADPSIIIIGPPT